MKDYTDEPNSGFSYEKGDYVRVQGHPKDVYYVLEREYRKKLGAVYSLQLVDQMGILVYAPSPNNAPVMLHPVPEDTLQPATPEHFKPVYPPSEARLWVRGYAPNVEHILSEEQCVSLYEARDKDGDEEHAGPSVETLNQAARDFAAVVNKHSLEALAGNVPDYIVGEYLVSCVICHGKTIRHFYVEREKDTALPSMKVRSFADPFTTWLDSWGTG